MKKRPRMGHIQLAIYLSRRVSFREMLDTVGRTPRPVLRRLAAAIRRWVVIKTFHKLFSIDRRHFSVIRRRHLRVTQHRFSVAWHFPVVGVKLFSRICRRRRRRRWRRAMRLRSFVWRVLTSYLLHSRIRVRFALIIKYLNYCLVRKVQCEHYASSVTRLGDFWKFLATSSLTIEAQKECWFWNSSIIVKMLWIFLCNSWKHLGKLPTSHKYSFSQFEHGSNGIIWCKSEQDIDATKMT